MTEKIYDYKKAFEDCAPTLLEMAQELDASFAIYGVAHPIAARLRILSAQFAAAGSGWQKLVPGGAIDANERRP